MGGLCLMSKVPLYWPLDGGGASVPLQSGASGWQPDMWVVRVGGDDGELRPWHYIYVYSIESRLIVRVRYDKRLPVAPKWLQQSTSRRAAANGSNWLRKGEDW